MGNMENETAKILKDILKYILKVKDLFPWQEKLLQKFIHSKLPSSVDLPTGLGKTSIMAIWLVARCSNPKLPRRLVYVVDRRAVVDQATEEALRLREMVDENSNLKQKLGLERSLLISTLRGQYVDNREWLDDPAAPAIIVGTVDMIGSRLLFEGYGVSRKMRPYHAGLLGADALVVLDEAHLVPPFEHLLRAIEKDFAPSAPVPQFRLLSLSATGRTRSDNVFGLTKDDREHSAVKRRLNARKSLRIKQLDKNTKLEDALAEQAWTLTDNGNKPVRVLVYSDSREIAQKAKEAVEKLAKGDKEAGTLAVQIDTELFVGGRRVFEREQAKERLEKLGFMAGSKVTPTRPVFLFATSAGEVGVDLDADHMVCDLVAWERMVQRLGRVNRRGDGEATVIVIPESEPDNIEALLTKSVEELSSKERETVDKIRRIREVREALKKLPQNHDESFDASPGALHNLKQQAERDLNLQQTIAGATTPEPLRPALTRPLVEAWAMTSLERHPGRPDIQPWLRGWIKDDPPQTAVVWRKYLPVRIGSKPPMKKEVETFFEAAPPHLSEILETETFRVVDWIVERAKRVSEQANKQRGASEEGVEEKPGKAEDTRWSEGQEELSEDSNMPSLNSPIEQNQRCEEDIFHLHEKDTVAFTLDSDGGLRKAFTLSELKTTDKKELRKFFAGATLILDARLGGLKDGLLDEREDSRPRTADDGQEWLGEGVVGFRVRSVDASTAVQRDRNWRERFRFASEVTQDGEATRWLIVDKWRSDAATEEDRSAANPQLLDEHQCWTEDRARTLAQDLGLDDRSRELLALAARLHDEGKRAQRWQRAFNAPKGGVYAKTEGPINYRLLDGYRHELGSLLRVENDERIQELSDEDRDLVLHLIAAHHGFARPVIGTSGCEDAPPSALEQKATEIALRFARLQARWGPWGLAWWEALLRAADQQASRDNNARVNNGGGV
jgi:CRISPR-associated endonuclease/helicase Cas3